MPATPLSHLYIYTITTTKNRSIGACLGVTQTLATIRPKYKENGHKNGHEFLLFSKHAPIDLFFVVIVYIYINVTKVLLTFFRQLFVLLSRPWPAAPPAGLSFTLHCYLVSSGLVAFWLIIRYRSWLCGNIWYILYCFAQSVCLSHCPYICPTIRQSVRTSIFRSVSVCSTKCLSFRLSVCLTVHLAARASIHP